MRFHLLNSEYKETVTRDVKMTLYSVQLGIILAENKDSVKGWTAACNGMSERF